MSPSDATKTLSHLPSEKLVDALALVSFIVGTEQEEIVAATTLGNVRQLDPDGDPELLETQIEALFTLARIDARMHALDSSH